MSDTASIACGENGGFPTNATDRFVLPDFIQNEQELDDFLARPRPVLIKWIQNVSSPLVILGASGKMGPTLALLARRAAEAANHPLDIIAVSRFRNPDRVKWFEEHGIRTQVCDLLDANSVRDLPETNNLIFMVGLKFGTSLNPSATWAANTIAPMRVAERYSHARIVALSTGNVYPLSATSRGGSIEQDPLTPLGEYANSAVARERIFEHYSHLHQTPMALLRLFYAVELRYGVLVDLAWKVLKGEPISLDNGYFNCIWQGDANEVILRSLSIANSPPSVWNLCRPEIYSVHDVAQRLGVLLKRSPQFVGAKMDGALLGNSAKLNGQLGPPATPLDRMLQWIAYWISHGGHYTGNPTHFEMRDGQY